MYTTYQDIQLRFPNINLDEQLVNVYIQEATDWIDEQTGVSFAPTISSATPKIYSTRVLTNTIIIDYAYEVETVEFLVGRTINQESWAVVDSTTYRITPENTTPKSAIEFIDSIGLNYPIYFEGNDANVRVTAKWGYSATVPADVKRIATQYVISMLRQDGAVESPISNERVGDASLTYSIEKSSYDIQNLRQQLLKYKDWGDIRL